MQTPGGPTRGYEGNEDEARLLNSSHTYINDKRDRKVLWYGTTAEPCEMQPLSERWRHQ